MLYCFYLIKGLAKVVMPRKGNYVYSIDDLHLNTHLKFQFRNQKKILGADVYDYTDNNKASFFVLGNI
jgi:hypothetical protein